MLTWDKASPSTTFPAAFYLHELAALRREREQEKFVEMPSNLSLKFAPDTLSIPEVRNSTQLELLTKLHLSHPLLNDPAKGWSVKIIREFNRTDDADLFHTERRGWPLIEGKSFHQFIPDYEKPVFYIDRDGLSTDISGDNRDSHGKYLDQSGRQTARTMQKWQRRIRVSAHGERKLASMLSKISEISDSLHFSNPIRDEASLILRKSTKRDFASGRKSAEGMAVASLYLACRKMGVNRSLKEIWCQPGQTNLSPANTTDS